MPAFSFRQLCLAERIAKCCLAGFKEICKYSSNRPSPQDEIEVQGMHNAIGTLKSPIKDCFQRDLKMSQRGASWMLYQLLHGVSFDILYMCQLQVILNL